MFVMGQETRQPLQLQPKELYLLNTQHNVSRIGHNSNSI
jgi:hypothetical protein